MGSISVNPKFILFLFLIPIFLISLAVHEFLHALIAYRFGDSTAKDLGRMTLNPFKHIDLIGTIFIPIAAFASGIALIGWAKPVPINKDNFSNVRFADAVVSLAGPFSNFVLAFLFVTMIYIFPNFVLFSNFQQEILLRDLIIYGIYINVFLFVFNLLPIPPLDGVHILHAILNNKITTRLTQMGFIGSLTLVLFIYSPLWKYFLTIVNFIVRIMIAPVI